MFLFLNAKLEDVDLSWFKFVKKHCAFVHVNIKKYKHPNNAQGYEHKHWVHKADNKYLSKTEE